MLLVLAGPGVSAGKDPVEGRWELVLDRGGGNLQSVGVFEFVATAPKSFVSRVVSPRRFALCDGGAYKDEDGQLKLEKVRAFEYRGTWTQFAGPSCVATTTRQPASLRLTGDLKMGTLTQQAPAGGNIVELGWSSYVRRVGPAPACGIDEQFAGWRLQAPCDDYSTKQGVTGLRITPPPGWKGGFSSGTVPYTVPLAMAAEADQPSKLFFPLVLPDLTVNTGGFSITAYENTLDHDGTVTVGTGGFSLPRYGVEALVHDLVIRGRGADVAVASLELDLFDASFSADRLTFGKGGVTAEEATVGLPDLLGGGSVSIAGFGIDRNGVVRGTITGAELHIGDITARVSKLGITPGGFSADSAELVLPSYLGGTTLAAEGLRYDGTSGTLSFKRARGGLDFNLAGGKLRVKANAELVTKPGNGYRITGSGFVQVSDVFKAEASVEIESVDCDTRPGPCRGNAVYLQQASISIEVGKPVPLGQTGLGIAGLRGAVKSRVERPYRDAAGNIRGVGYAFTLGAGVQTIADSGFVLDGNVQGTLSTDGNFGLSVEATTLRFVKLNGGVCIRFAAVRDEVCDAAIVRNRAKVVDTGVFLEAGAEAGVSYEGWLGRGEAILKANAFGRLVRSAGRSYVDASIAGTISATAQSRLGDGEASGEVAGELGSFSDPEAGTVLGIKGTLSANLRLSNSYGEYRQEVTRAFFIDERGRYTENVNAYAPVAPREPAAVSTSRTYSFSIPRGQTQTMITLSWPTGKRKLTLTRPVGSRLTQEQAARSVYVVRLGVPNTLAIYLPAAEPGRWTARIDGGGIRSFNVRGNQPLPAIAIMSPPKDEALAAVPGRPRVSLQGTLRGQAGQATISVSVATTPCVERQGRRPATPGTLIAARVPVRGGVWRYAWDTRATPAGRYWLYATLDNGSGPLVRTCGGSVDVRQPARLAPPLHLGARLLGGQLELRWRPPARASLVTGYVVRWRAGTQAAWHKLDVGSAVRVAISVPLSAVGYEAEVAAYDTANHQSAWSRARVKARTASVKTRPRSPATGVVLLSRVRASVHRAVHAAGQKLPVPVFYVGAGTPEIAENDAAAISGTDPGPLTPGKARTVRAGQYVPYPCCATTKLHYGRLSPSTGYKPVSKTNRKIACGARPFRIGGKPGPPSGSGRYRRTSCDEYPFASAVEGGTGAIIRGVTLAENLQQGRDLSAFLRTNAVALAQNSGEFRICVQHAGKRYGACPR
jgi:hypothetical protein